MSEGREKQLARAAKRWRTAQARQDNAKAALQQAIEHAVNAGMSERSIAPLVGVDRMTLRRWAGKHTSAQQRAARTHAGVDPQ